MIKIGITGSLASGKTTASKILSFRRGPLFSADKAVKELYKNIMQMETIPPEKFPRTAATDKAGYDGKIKFVTEGSMQMLSLIHI